MCIRLKEAEENYERINMELSLVIKEKEQREILLLEKEALEKNMSDLKSCIEDGKANLSAQKKQYEQTFDTALVKLEKNKENLAEINKENAELCYNIIVASKEYNAKVEEKNSNLLSKLELEKIANENEILMVQIRLLEEQIEQKKKNCQELSEKINMLSNDKSLQEHNKKKPYLMSSTEYLIEKQKK
ncbi:hypothetical protein NQ317_004350, partial [Molorchus minor]